MDEMKFPYSIDSLGLYTHTLKYIRAIDALRLLKCKLSTFSYSRVVCILSMLTNKRHSFFKVLAIQSIFLLDEISTIFCSPKPRLQRSFSAKKSIA